MQERAGGEREGRRERERRECREGIHSEGQKKKLLPLVYICRMMKTIQIGWKGEIPLSTIEGIYLQLLHCFKYLLDPV